MRVLDSWRKTKDFFERKNVSVFALVTLKALKTMAKTITMYFALLLMIMLGIELLYHRLTATVGCCVLAMYVCMVAFVILLHLILRPSTARKDWQYYQSYVKHSMVLMLSPVWILFWLLTFYANTLIGREHGVCLLCLILLLLAGIACLMAYSAFTIFFFLDSRMTFKSFIKAHVKAAKMLVYNVPICLVVTMLLEVIEICYVVLGLKLYDILIGRLGYSMFPVAVAFLVRSSIFLLFVPVVVSVLSSMYIKFLHEQPDVYFDQPK